MKKHPIFAASINAAKNRKVMKEARRSGMDHYQFLVARPRDRRRQKKSITLLFILLWMPHFISIFTV